MLSRVLCPLYSVCVKDFIMTTFKRGQEGNMSKPFSPSWSCYHWKLFFFFFFGPAQDSFGSWERLFSIELSPHMGHSWLFQQGLWGVSWTPQLLTQASLTCLDLNQQSCGGSVSPQPSHSYPLTWKEISRQLLEAFSILQIVLKNICCLFFSPFLK